MDTITQALLGGAVGYAVAGKTSRRKALLWGAAIAVLPDLDVFIPYDNDLDSMTFHRSWTHSWLVHTAVAPLLGMLMSQLDKTFSFRTWSILIWLALVTHAGLDALTVYGTQLFWPLMPPPISGGSVFIIDPVYSIPLLAGFIAILVVPRYRWADKLQRYTFVFSCIYLLWGFTAQQWVGYQARQALAEQKIDYQHMQVSATAFNTLLWRVLVVNDTHYYEGFRSLLDDGNQLRFNQYDRGKALIAESQDLPSFQRISWFTNGLFKLERHGGQIIASDLRMGMEPSYFFRFLLAENHGHGFEPSVPNRARANTNRRDGIRWVWQRITDPTVQFKADSGSM